MWRFQDNAIIFIPGDSRAFMWEPYSVDFSDFDGEVYTISSESHDWSGYDTWVHSFDPNDEIMLLQTLIQRAEENPLFRAHIRGISLAESTHILGEYYQKQGYEDSLGKNYILPASVQVTASISLRHALWCEKDKGFLHTKDTRGIPYGMISPPIRGSHDLRLLQQSLRMNMIMGIEVFPGDRYLIDQLVESEILPPFSVAQMIHFRWKKLLQHTDT